MEFAKRLRRKYQWIPDLPDHRDIIYKSRHSIKASKLPKSKSLKGKMSPVEDQGYLGSCTAQAFAGNLEFLYLKKKDQFQASRLFIYYNERVYINTVHEDSGAYIRDGIKTLVQHGVCPEEMIPYNERAYTVKPSDEAYQEALKRRITTYERITDINSMKHCLASGYPFVFGISIYESFESDKATKTGTIPTPKPNEKLLGGHAMLCVGYNDKTKRFLVRNSWGTEWGSKGYCTIPYDYFISQADDMWTVKA